MAPQKPAPEEGEDARAEYAGLDDQHAMHKAAFLGDVVEARRIAGEHADLQDKLTAVQNEIFNGNQQMD